MKNDTVEVIAFLIASLAVFVLAFAVGYGAAGLAERLLGI